MRYATICWMDVEHSVSETPQEKVHTRAYVYWYNMELDINVVRIGKSILPEGPII